MIDALRSELAALAPATAPLEPDAAAREALMNLAFGHAQEFLRGLAEGPSYQDPAEAHVSPLEPEFAEQGRDPAAMLAYLGRSVDRPGITTASPQIGRAHVCTPVT